MNPTARDYDGDEAKPLVPGSLRVFRHFQVDFKEGLIAPMSHTPAPRWVLGPDPSHSYLPHRDTHRAHCFYYAGGSSAFGRAHAVPNARCSCGFYAHYDPATDFYPNWKWGVGLVTAYGTDLEMWGQTAMVRAVCEVSGTVVMGRLGVRAEKLKIVAIAPDWGKYTPPRIGAHNRGAGWFEMMSPWDLPRIYRREEHLDRERVMDGIASVVDHYPWVKVYTDPVKMYDDHPKADVSALVDTKPKPKQWGRVGQAALYADGFKADLMIVDEATPEGVAETVREKALRLKRERPAPPGVGIDRRKRKL